MSRSMTHAFLCMLVLAAIITPLSSTAAKSKPIRVSFAPLHFVYDGIEYVPPADQRAFIYEGTTYIPIRFMSYLFDKAVVWDGDTYTVSVEEPNKEESIMIQEYKLNTMARDSEITTVDKSKITYTNIEVIYRNVTYVFNGIESEGPAEPSGLFFNDRIYVPFRYFGNMIDLEIDWDDKTYTISAESAEYKQALELMEAVYETTRSQTQGASGTGSETVEAARYDKIIASVEQSIASLQSEAEDFYFSLLLQYTKAKTVAEKAQFIETGRSKLSEYDQRFADLMGALRNELSENGFSTEQADLYEEEYEAIKQLARSFIGL